MKKKITRFLSLILVCTCLISSINVFATTHKLNMNDRRQENSNWCWAAVIQMIVDYLGAWSPVPSQSNIVTSLKGSPVNQGATAMEITNVFGWYGVSTTHRPISISFSDIKNMLSGWYSPIGTSIVWTDGSGAHSQIIYGYEENVPYQGVYILDPKMSGAQRLYYNLSDYINNSEFYWSNTWFNNKKSS